MSEDHVSVEELAEKADEYLHETSLTPEEYEALKHSVAELAPMYSAARSYFVLGSYGRPEIRRLQLVKDRLNRRPDAYAFLMVDVRGEWTNTYLKFRLLADYADYIVGVAEHSRGGFLVEQGYLSTARESRPEAEGRRAGVNRVRSDRNRRRCPTGYSRSPPTATL